MRLLEDSTLYKGIFWIVDENDPHNNSNYCFKIDSDTDGNAIELDDIGIAKSGNTYNHKLVWNQLPKAMTCGKPYNYFPRGRVEIHNGVAKIFLNGNINYGDVITFLKHEFNLTPHNGMKKVQVIEDNSSHYLCYLDAEKGWKPAQK